MIDAYAHVGLPRFMSLADYRGVMARAGIARAVLCSFDSSPDLGALHDAVTHEPGTFRAVGVPLGRDRAELETAAAAQLDAGFSGLRLTEADVADRPWLLDALGRAGAVALVVGAVSSPVCAAALLRNLDRYSALSVVGGHFAGAGNPALLDAGPAAALFAHPRFHVQFSRQGGWPAQFIQRWAEAVLARTGWDRVLWGTEAPVLFWRNETAEGALAWLDTLKPSPAERTAATETNAARLYFHAQPTTGPLHLPFNPVERSRPIPAVLSANGWAIDQALAGRLVHDWLAASGKGTLGDHVAALLARTVKPE